jgi:hypothetical protein
MTDHADFEVFDTDGAARHIVQHPANPWAVGGVTLADAATQRNQARKKISLHVAKFARILLFPVPAGLKRLVLPRGPGSELHVEVRRVRLPKGASPEARGHQHVRRQEIRQEIPSIECPETRSIRCGNNPYRSLPIP